MARLSVPDIGWYQQHHDDVPQGTLLMVIRAEVLDGLILVLLAGRMQNTATAPLEVSGPTEESHDGPRH